MFLMDFESYQESEFGAAENVSDIDDVNRMFVRIIKRIRT